MRRYLFLLSVLIVLLAIAQPAMADELRVGGDGLATLTEAVAKAAAGDVIWLPAGSYCEPDEAYPIIVDKSLTIIGEDGAVLNASPFKALIKVTAPDVTIENVEFQLLRYGVLGLADRLSLIDCSFILADDTYRVSSCGAWLAGAYSCRVSGCGFTGCGLAIAGPPLSERSKQMPVLTGLFEVGEDRALFTSHEITDNTVNGKPLYYFINQENVTVPKDAGLAIVACCQNVVAQGLDVSDSSMGLEIIHCSDVIVRDVIADRSGIFGIYIAYIDVGVVERVICRNSNHGIDIRMGKNVTVTHCEAIDCDQGIFLSWAFDSLVDQCQMIRCGNGFFIAAGSGNIISRSLSQGNENGLYLQGEEKMLVWDNEITQNTVAGLRILKSSGQMVGNSLRDNWVGMLVGESTELTLLGNAFVDEQSAALYMRDVTDAQISLNRFEGEKAIFLELDEQLIGVQLEQNDFQGGAEQVISRLDTPLDLSRNAWQDEQK